MSNETTGGDAALHPHTPGDRKLRALGGSARDYKVIEGADILGRVGGFLEWQKVRQEEGLWPYSKSCMSAPRGQCDVVSDTGHAFSGVNFGSQDYLSLSSHPAVADAAKTAIDQFGVHSAGSAALLGNNRYSIELENQLSEFLGGREIVLYPTGWGAGFGSIQGLVRRDDHVLMDVLNHSCLQEGALAATPNIHFHGHLNVESAARKMKRIREKDTKNGILVVTESLFSMHSDTPDLMALRSACDEYNACLLVDGAHDIGSIGHDGLGHMGLQHMLDGADIIVGSFSKTFASNGGFIAVKTKGAKEYLKYYSATQTFSNALSPAQAATVLKSLEIVRSQEGQDLRAELMGNILYLRNQLGNAGLEVLGNPSPIVPVGIGAESLARIASKRIEALGVIANLVEYPAVPRANARFRLQVMAKHTRAEIDTLVERMKQAMDEAKAEAAALKSDPSSVPETYCESAA